MKTDGKNSGVIQLIPLLLFCVAMGLSIWGIHIYRITIIPVKILFATISIGAIILLPIVSLVFKPLSGFWRIAMSIIVGAGLSYFLALFANKQFSSPEVQSTICPIIKTGSLSGKIRSKCRRTYAIINYQGKEKELIFDCGYDKTITSYSSVRIDYKMGLFGYPIIMKKQLLQ